jgi:hypothetical protein
MKRRTFVAGLTATAGLPRAVLAQASGAIPEIVLFYAGPIASAEARAKLVRDTLSAEGLALLGRPTTSAVKRNPDIVGDGQTDADRPVDRERHASADLPRLSI